MEKGRPKNNDCILRSRSVVVCNMHPRHKQSPGVCSVCLGDKLSQISASSSDNIVDKANTISYCSSSFSSSCYSSSEGSPVHHKYRMASMKHGTMNEFLRAKREDMFRKSKSVAATIERVRDGEGKEKERKNKKKKGFWSKLLRPRRKKIETGLAHSSNMATTRVH